ncbi:testis-expressed protein 22 isoform X4 [Pan paniscus]|uniref:testis-expressed protein 22 isoform X4 n=1 Tax=Pan paniscus TaxID=9597 RepID=UPI003005FB4C
MRRGPPGRAHPPPSATEPRTQARRRPEAEPAGAGLAVAEVLERGAGPLGPSSRGVLHRPPVASPSAAGEEAGVAPLPRAQAAPTGPDSSLGPAQYPEQRSAGTADSGLGVRAAGTQAPGPPLERQHRRAPAAGHAGRPGEAGRRRDPAALQDGSPAGVGGRGQGRAPSPPAEVHRVHQRLPGLPGAECAFLA